MERNNFSFLINICHYTYICAQFIKIKTREKKKAWSPYVRTRRTDQQEEIFKNRWKISCEGFGLWSPDVRSIRSCGNSLAKHTNEYTCAINSIKTMMGLFKKLVSQLIFEVRTPVLRTLVQRHHDTAALKFFSLTFLLKARSSYMYYS